MKQLKRIKKSTNDVSEITVILNAKTDIYIGSAKGQIKVECQKIKIITSTLAQFI